MTREEKVNTVWNVLIDHDAVDLFSAAYDVGWRQHVAEEIVDALEGHRFNERGTRD